MVFKKKRNKNITAAVIFNLWKQQFNMFKINSSSTQFTANLWKQTSVLADKDSYRNPVYKLNAIS